MCKLSKRLAGVGAVWVKCSYCGYLHIFSKKMMNKENPDYNCRECGKKNIVEGLK